METLSPPVMDVLEERTLYSVTIAQSHVIHGHTTHATKAVNSSPAAPVKLVRSSSHGAPALATRSDATPNGFVISFLGLGGIGWSNSLVTTMTADVAAQTNSVARTYMESQGDAALQDLFQSIDANGDHIITAGEIAGVNVRVLGYSFGGIQAANFTEALNDVGGTEVGYKLRVAIPVHSLVTIDPVNSTPEKHTDGVRSNVRSFTNFFQHNAGPSNLILTNSTTGQSAGDVFFAGDENPTGDALKSAAAHTRQIRTDLGAFGQRVTTHAYDATHDATIASSDVDHATMPWFLYDDVVAALK